MRHRKKLLPTIILNIILWLGVIYIVFFTSPDAYYIIHNTYYNVKIPITVIALFLTLTLSLTLTLGLILRSTKKGFILALAFSIFFFLKMLKIINWLNILILIALTVIMFLA